MTVLDEMTRVCLLTPELAPAGGGIGTYTAALSEVLRGTAEVTLVTREEDRHILGAAHPELDIAYVPPGDEQSWTAAAVEVIERHYGGRGPDVLEATDFLGVGYGPLVARAEGSSALRRTRIVVRLHTTSEIGDVLDGVDISTPYKTALHAMERATLVAADRLVWPYGDVFGTYQRFYGRRSLTAPLKLGHPLAPVAVEAHAARPDDDVLHVVHVGRLERRKGVHHLLQALLAQRSDRWQLDLLGADTATGPGGTSMLETLEAMARGDQRVSYLGHRPRQEVDAAVACADLLVLPSLWEAAAYTVLEAMQAGCPVLSTPVGGMVELVEPGVTGFLSRATGVEALAVALAPLVDDPGRARSLRASGAPQRRVAELTAPETIRAGVAALATLPVTPRPIPEVTAPGRPPRWMRWEARGRHRWSWR